jgi:Spy/CpxP family protein refolding chaperone
MVLAAAGTVGMAANPEVGARRGRWPGADTPLGRMISGNIGRLLVLRSELNVTPQQREQMRDVLLSHRSEIASTVKSVRDKRVVLRKAILEDGSSEAEIRAAADELGDAIADAAVKAARLRGQLAPILTGDQRAKIADFLAERDMAVDSFLEKVAGQ